MMNETDLDVGVPGFEAFDPKFVARTVQETKQWLATHPEPNTLARNVAALEFSFAAAINNRDTGLAGLAWNAMERIQDGARLEALSNNLLAAWIGLDLRAFHFTRDARFQEWASRGVACANTRWDEQNAFFKASAADTTSVFYTDANARLGEQFYRAWRALDDQTLRPKAGEVLGLVSDLFDAGAGLYQRKEMPGGAPSEPDRLDAYAAAIPMFVAASQTTGRGTYIARACIVANDALNRFHVTAKPLREQFDFGMALARLARFDSAAQYQERAHEILRRVTQEFTFPIVP